MSTGAPATASVSNTPTPTPTVQPPSRVLFLHGDSPWFVAYYFPILAASGNPPIIVENLGIRVSGARMASYLYGEKPLKEVRAATGHWDIVVLYENTADLWETAGDLPESARKLDEEIRKAGSKTLLFMPWQRAWEDAVPQIGQIAELYDKTAAELGVNMAPVGLAFARSLAERPQLDLYNSDKFRANAYGAYLTLCVLYATIFQRSPVGLAYRMEGMPTDAPRDMAWSNPPGWHMTDDDAAFLQRVAWETVQDYQAQHPIQATPTPAK
jgi:hypothetical protein